MPEERPPIWPQQKHASIAPVLARLLSTRGDNGWPVSFQFFLDQRTLLAWSISKRMNGGILLQALTKMIERGEVTIEELENACYVVIDKQDASFDAESQEWTFWIPFHVAFPSPPRGHHRVTLLGTGFSVVTHRACRRQFTDREIINSLHRQYDGPPILPSYWIRVRRVAPNALAGWNQLMPAYDAFRGLIELVYNLGHVSLFAWPPTARHACIPPPWCLVAPASGHFEFYPFGNRETLNEEPLVLIKSAWKQIRLVAELIKSEPRGPQDFRWLIGDLFRLYSQAMDADRPYSTFLGFWQLAEAITLVGERQGNHNEAIVRLATFLRGVDSDAALSVLRALYKKRCEAVHRGIYNDIHDDDVDFLKTVVDTAMLWCIRELPKLGDRQHLEEYYRLHGWPAPKLEVAKRAIKYVEVQRRRRK